jgi:NitT/TauT family transport system substrate-binding protein
MTIAMNSNDGFAAHLMKKFPLEGVKVVRYSGNLAAFLRDKNMAQQAYVFSEPIIAREQGASVRALMVAETGYNPYTSLLIVREALAESDPDLVRRMTRASIRGWQSYIQSPEKTNAHIQTLFPELTETILREGVKKLIPLVVPDGMAPERIGEQTRERWAELVATMEDSGQIEVGRVDPAACFTDRFMK